MRRKAFSIMFRGVEGRPRSYYKRITHSPWKSGMGRSLNIRGVIWVKLFRHCRIHSASNYRARNICVRSKTETAQFVNDLPKLCPRKPPCKPIHAVVKLGIKRKEHKRPELLVNLSSFNLNPFCSPLPPPHHHHHPSLHPPSCPYSPSAFSSTPSSS